MRSGGRSATHTPRGLIDISVLKITDHACKRFAQRILRCDEPTPHDKFLAKRIISRQLKKAKRVERVNNDEAFALSRCVVIVRDQAITTVYTRHMHERRHDR